MARRDDDFVAFVDARSAALLRTARLLSAGDLHAAEDLVQTALEAGDEQEIVVRTQGMDTSGVRFAQ